MISRFQKINILFLIDQFRSDRAGTERQLINLFNRLENKKYNIYLATLKESSWLNKYFIHSEKKVFSLYANNGIPIDLFKTLKIMKRIIEDKKIDIIQSFFIDSIFVAIISAKISKQSVAVVTTRRDMGYWYTPLKLFFIRLANKLTDAILVNSFPVQKNVIRRELAPANKVVVIGNGLDERWFSICPNNHKQIRSSLNISENEVLLGFVGNLRKIKRADLFIRGLSLLNKQFSYWKAIIIGDGNERIRLERLAQDKGIFHKIIFTGSVADPLPFYSAMDVGVCCSDSEGLSNSILEMMAQGLPVLSSRIPSNETLFGCGGFFFEPGETSCLANKLALLCEDQLLRQKLGTVNREIAKKFRWCNVIEQYDAFYEKMARVSRG